MKRIVVIGPESTGKSTLCEELAVHYRTSWVPEYARAFLLEHGTQYTYDDLLVIAKRQLQMEDDYAQRTNSKLLFIDTDMYVMKIWCEFVFGKCHQWILDRIAERKYDMYLLCNTDLPWTKDELREYPDLESRLHLFHMYKDTMVGQHIPWKEIKGTLSDRLTSAVKAVESLL
jgi:NadR type nicotinamide-nucleotide adenylyltransferase